VQTLCNDTISVKEKTTAYLKQIYDIPVYRDAVTDVKVLLKDPEVSYSKLAKTIERDHGLAIKVLAAANSPKTGLPKRVYTIERAVILLGLKKIIEIVSSVANQSSLEISGSEEWYKNIFWRHSVLVANTAKAISEDLGFENPDHVFTAGFLHDVGILIIRNFFSHEHSEIYALVEQDNCPYEKAEKINLGMNHPLIGRIVIDQFHLPDIIANAVEYNHMPSESGEGIVVSSIVHLAEFMVNWIGMSKTSWDAGLKLDENIISILKLGSRQFEGQFSFVYQDIFREVLHKRSCEN
jgi:HD-like signal output (HDOD) protein